MVAPYEITMAELTGILADEPSYRVAQVWKGLHVLARRPAEMTDIPRSIRDRLEAAMPPSLRPLTRSVSDDGQTVKWLWELGDGARVETVLMHYRDRTTVCVSSQAGCAMGCTFCATGQAGFTRQLRAGEIVEQVIAAIRESNPRRVTNVVFMGMGEPLANYDRLWVALRRLHDDVGISARHLTVSTVGVVPGIRRLAAEDLPVNLAVSLHAANDRLRDRLVPLNKRYPLSVLMEACRGYLVTKGRRLSFEWALIDGVNDRNSDAAELAELAGPLGAHVNLIPLNPTPGYPVTGTRPDGVARFRRLLGEAGINATVRRNRGTDIDAACGQLAARAATELSDRDSGSAATGEPSGAPSTQTAPVTLRDRPGSEPPRLVTPGVSD
jgi:23S rRNA (adenine2503-C2)-methyltransferase